MLVSPLPGRIVAGSKPAAVVLDAERQDPPSRAAQLHPDPGRSGVLGGVLERLQAAEVRRRLQARRVATDGLRGELDRHRAVAQHGSQRDLQSALGEQRRIDAAAQLEHASRPPPPPPPPGRPAAAPRVRVSPEDRVWASRRFTARATRCCWAPSWTSRSSARRSLSCASTSRCRESRSSSARADSSAARRSSSARRRAPRSIRPAWSARPGEEPLLHRGERHLVALPDDQHAQQLAAVPHHLDLPPRLRRLERVLSTARPAHPGARWPPGSADPPPSATPAPTPRRCPWPAPGPSATAAPRRRTCPVTVSENWLSTSYGDARPPCTARERELVEERRHPVEGQCDHRGGEDRERHGRRRRVATQQGTAEQHHDGVDERHVAEQPGQHEEPSPATPVATAGAGAPTSSWLQSAPLRRRRGGGLTEPLGGGGHPAYPPQRPADRGPRPCAQPDRHRGRESRVLVTPRSIERPLTPEQPQETPMSVTTIGADAPRSPPPPAPSTSARATEPATPP